MERFCVLAGRNDPAGYGIVQALQKRGQQDGIIFHITDSDILNKDDVENEVDADVLFFASKHASKEGRPAFSCHAAGNWGDARFGGRPKELCVAPALLLKKMFIALKESAKGLPYDVTLEATHHGPLVRKPSLFVEIGSNEEEWKKVENADVVASAIIRCMSAKNTDCGKVAVGLGGPHYCSQFNKLQEGGEIAIGHICPKHSLPSLDKSMIIQAWERTIPKPDFFLLDWKGLGPEKQRIVGLLKECGFPFRRTDEF